MEKTRKDKGVDPIINPMHTMMDWHFVKTKYFYDHLTSPRKSPTNYLCRLIHLVVLDHDPTKQVGNTT